MSDFKEMLKDVEAVVTKDPATSTTFRELLETIACYLNDIDMQANRKLRTVDVIIITLLILNLITTAAVYMMVR